MDRFIRPPREVPSSSPSRERLLPLDLASEARGLPKGCPRGAASRSAYRSGSAERERLPGACSESPPSLLARFPDPPPGTSSEVPTAAADDCGATSHWLETTECMCPTVDTNSYGAPSCSSLDWAYAFEPSASFSSSRASLACARYRLAVFLSPCVLSLQLHCQLPELRAGGWTRGRRLAARQSSATEE